MKKNLVVLRCGNRSLHSAWASSDHRNWDIVLCPYEEIDETGLPTFPMYSPELKHLNKFSGLYKFFCETEIWQQYDFLWLPDDDIETDADTIDRLFDMCTQVGAELAAPALTTDSFYSHLITLANDRFCWRLTTFVELMVPCFSAAFMRTAIKTFDLSESGLGFGLDFLWPAMLNYKSIFIFDDVKVRHTRPVGGFRSPEQSTLATKDMNLIIKGMNIPTLYKTIAGQRKDQKFSFADDQCFLLDYIQGYRSVIQNKSGVIQYLVELQLANVPQGEQKRYEELVKFHLARKISSGFSVARGKPALVSSVSEYSRSQDPAIEARGGNDGIIDGTCGFHTAFETDPWWQVDLENKYQVSTVQVYNRLDMKWRCTRMTLFFSDDGENWTLVGLKLDDTEFGGADGFPHIFKLSPSISTRYVRVRMLGDGFLHFDQIEVFREFEPTSVNQTRHARIN